MAKVLVVEDEIVVLLFAEIVLAARRVRFRCLKGMILRCFSPTSVSPKATLPVLS
jgi:hypothetical protein